VPLPTDRPTPPAPPGAATRPASWDDLDAVASVHAACARARRGRPRLRPGDVRARWLGLDSLDDVTILHDPADPRRVLAVTELTVDVDPDRAEVEVNVEGQVHPDHVGRGLATWLLDRADERARAEVAANGATAACLTTTVVDGDDRARAYFTDRGFVPVRHLLQLRLDLYAAPPAPSWPRGVRVRSFVPGRDEAAVWRTHQAAFADVATSWPMDLDDLVADRLRPPGGLDPELVLLAHAEGVDDPIGVAICLPRSPGAPEEGWVRDLGVVPAWRRRGVAMALLRESFARFRARGLTGVALDVDDVTVDGAVQLYRRAGMRIVHRTDVVQRPVPLDARPPQAGEG
jgi:mycothiol synthase